MIIWILFKFLCEQSMLVWLGDNYFLALWNVVARLCGVSLQIVLDMDCRCFHHRAPQILSLICGSYFGDLGCELNNAVDGGRSKIRHCNLRHHHLPAFLHKLVMVINEKPTMASYFCDSSVGHKIKSNKHDIRWKKIIFQFLLHDKLYVRQLQGHISQACRFWCNWLIEPILLFDLKAKEARSNS